MRRAAFRSLPGWSMPWDGEDFYPPAARGRVPIPATSRRSPAGRGRGAVGCPRVRGVSAEGGLKRFAWAGLALFGAASAFAADEDPVENARLPRLWKVTSRTKAPAEQVAAIAKKLGVGMTSLENNVLDAGGIRLQINVAR